MEFTISPPRIYFFRVAEIEAKYREAIELYKTTDLTISEISKRCHVSRSGLAAYIQRKHRDLMLKRHGMSSGIDRKLRKSKGQSPETRRKYQEAIEACDSMSYIELNVSQIAKLFNLNGTALANQLRAHYPDIIPRREAERRRLGIADNAHRGVSRRSSEMYEEALTLLRTTDYTIEEVAELCNVPFSGLRQHVLYYHKDIAKLREVKRHTGMDVPKIGKMSGNGRMRQMSDEVKDRYAEGVELYRTTSLPISEISKRIGVNASTFRSHLRLWYKGLMFERIGAEHPVGSSDREKFGDAKKYKKSTAEKYCRAIQELKTSDDSTESVARKFGFNPEVFRSYLKEHEPELYESQGMITLPNGRTVLKRSYKRYCEAIETYRATSESLKSIATRLGITYNSLSGFIRRNFPELIDKRKNKKVKR